MATLPPLVRENPVATLLTTGALLAAVASVVALAVADGVVLAIRVAALAVVLAAFAVGFWAGPLAERYA